MKGGKPGKIPQKTKQGEGTEIRAQKKNGLSMVAKLEESRSQVKKNVTDVGVWCGQQKNTGTG